jgi:nucleoside-diphosphate-sugar epimerase
MKCASCRHFTVHGPRGVENHAVIAIIGRGFVKLNPFDVWGNGKQIRNRTYIDDTVSGTILAAEKIDDGTDVNLGTMERDKVTDAVHDITRTFGYHPKIEPHPEMPSGPLNRVAENSLAKKLLGCGPTVMFRNELHRTIDRYVKTRTLEAASSALKTMLTER